MSLITLGVSRIMFPTLERRRCDNFGVLIAHTSISMNEKKKMNKPILFYSHFSDWTVEKMA